MNGVVDGFQQGQHLDRRVDVAYVMAKFFGRDGFIFQDKDGHGRGE